jgi:hypothetical protein
MTDLAGALSALTATLERLNLPYAIGGSLASSSHGVWRATNDVDIVAGVPEALASQVSAALGPDWYAEANAMRDAIRAGRAFNVIHIPTSYKFDLFPATSDFHAVQLQRASKISVTLPGGTVECPVTTAEDILLAKLRWFADGGEVSERQWRDIHGILATNRDLDFDYIDLWAGRLGVSRLLAKALSERAAD